MRGPEEAVVRVALKPESGVRIEQLKHDLRDELPKRLGDWLRQRLQQEGLPEVRIHERIAGLRFSFEPADIVNEVMSFGSATPIEVAVSGPKFADTPRLRRKSPPRARRDSLAARLAIRAAARLSGRRRRRRPRTGRSERVDRKRHVPGRWYRRPLPADS